MYLATLASVITSTAVQHSGACQHDYGPSLEATEATEAKDTVLISRVRTKNKEVNLVFGKLVRVISPFKCKYCSYQFNKALVFQGGIPDYILFRSTLSSAADLGESL